MEEEKRKLGKLAPQAKDPSSSKSSPLQTLSITLYYLMKQLKKIFTYLNKPAVQAADADPPPMKLHQEAKSTPSVKWL